jgi:hypothetical protein
VGHRNFCKQLSDLKGLADVKDVSSPAGFFERNAFEHWWRAIGTAAEWHRTPKRPAVRPQRDRRGLDAAGTIAHVLMISCSAPPVLALVP